MKKLLHKKWLWVVIIIMSLLFIGAQFIRPDIINPPVTSEIIVPGSVKEVLRKACYDCHSNETKLSWFDKITPANWLVSKHIREGRAALNFSEWDNLSGDQQKAVLFESLNLIQFNIMPLQQYKTLHRAAKIGTAEINLLKSYLKTQLVVQVPDTNKTSKWNVQYSKWIQATATPQVIKPAPNGIIFMAGYKNWTVVSCSERSDKGTMRVILGNDIAVKAIQENHINPWPDGSALAKIIWMQVIEASGDIHAGEFIQADFMIKDKETFRSTDGWGYSRWVKGTELVPYGNNALFTTECANCHRSMKENDYVFTTPVDLNIDPGLKDKVLSASVNKENGTMTILYGNDIAAQFARTHTGKQYPAGAILTMATWFQKEDAHWFSATIPGNIQFIEKVRFGDEGDLNVSPCYEKYEGNPRKKTGNGNLYEAEKRLCFILSQRAAVMP